MKLGLGFVVVESLLLTACGTEPRRPLARLSDWERGMRIESPDRKGMAVFLWFYEWNMFQAIRQGVNTTGTFELPREFSPDGRQAEIRSYMMRLTATALPDGADLRLQVTNRSDRSWSTLAGVIPCFNPGRRKDTSDAAPEPDNPQFGDLRQQKTYFLGPDGLSRLDTRAIHFNEHLRPEVDRAAGGQPFPFSERWPTSEENAKAGIIIRESEDGAYVAGIAWADFLSAQAHNPWHCMHLCVCVGPLDPGQSKVIRGRIYLFKGNKEGCLSRFFKDFPNARASQS